MNNCFRSEYESLPNKLFLYQPFHRNVFKFICIASSPSKWKKRIYFCITRNAISLLLPRIHRASSLPSFSPQRRRILNTQKRCLQRRPWGVHWEWNTLKEFIFHFVGSKGIKFQQGGRRDTPRKALKNKGLLNFC